MTEPLAIIGMACRLPGADGLEAFWNLVVEGRTAWGKLPESRLRRDLYFDPEKGKVGRTYSDIGGLVSERAVDPRRCPITDDLLSRYDIAHHIFLEVASDACRDAALDPFAMPAECRTGVYVGHTGGSPRINDIVYSSGIAEATAILNEVEAARLLLGDDTSAVAAEVTAEVRRRYPGRMPHRRLDLGALGAAGIVHEALRLSGPYLVVDAACASSLQALAIAGRSLLAGGIDQAIVGGASYCKSDSLVLFSAAHSVSASGSCPFGEAADGLVTAEGYVAIVVKTLARAVADGDRIRAVIRGFGVASDGKGKSLWAPRQEGQIAAVQRAYADPADLGRLDYIETHATSTQVGDATELAALARAITGQLPPGRQLPIGSVKANIGHTLETAGIASLVKVVLAMEHGVIPPGSTCEELSREFDWERGPFIVPRTAVPWPRPADGSPRLAAVNAFGIGGLNVHLAIGEHRPTATDTRSTRNGRGRGRDDDAIAIVGAGCILPGALTREAFFQLLDRGETAIGPVPADRWDPRAAFDAAGPRTWHTAADIGGFVRGFAYDWRRHKVPPKQIAAANPLQFMLLEAADEALADAGGLEAIDRQRTAVVVGTLFGGDFSNQLQLGLRIPETEVYLREALERRGIGPAERDRIVADYGKKILQRMPALVDETGSFTSSTLASRLTKTFDLMGGALALDAGDCSSVAALAAATDMLRTRHCDAVLCAAGERFLDFMGHEGRSLLDSLADRPACVLEDRRTGGDVPGEGAVVFVLKRLADARAAGGTIHGVIRGIGLGGDRTALAAVERAVGLAHRDAGIEPGLVGAVQVATAAGHEKSGQELEALGAAYDRHGIGPVAGTLDGLIGHTGAVAGAAGLLALMRALRAGSLPATAGLAPPRRRVHGLEAAGCRLPIAAVAGGDYRAGGVTVLHDEQGGHVVVDNAVPLPEPPRLGTTDAMPKTVPADTGRQIPGATERVPFTWSAWPVHPNGKTPGGIEPPLVVAGAAGSDAGVRRSCEADIADMPGEGGVRLDVTRRYRLEAVDRAAVYPVRSLVGERVLLLGEDPLAAPLETALRSVGARPEHRGGGDAADSVRMVEESGRTGGFRHLVVLAGRPACADGNGWPARRERALAAPYFACQSWIAARLACGGIFGSTLTAVVDLGGDFGLSARIPAADGGGLAGLFKGLAREFPDLHVRVIDAPAGLPAAVVADAVVAEMCDQQGAVETGLASAAGPRRVTVVPREAALDPGGRPPAALDPGGVWLIAGGARGVTAACALELARRHRLSLALVGSTRPVEVSPESLELDEGGRRELMTAVMRGAHQRGEDPRSAWRNVANSIEIAASLRRFAEAGVEARYLSCDLTDGDAVQGLVERVMTEIGPIRGIVHGAGQESACRFERKSRMGFEATLGPKCLGLEHLMAAVNPASLRCLVAFGSTSGRLGGLGQADYSLANDLLAKSVAAWRTRRPGLLATTFHWHAWSGVGMAWRPESRLVLERLGVRFMPLEEGVRRFVEEIEAGLPEAEVLVTEPALCPFALPPNPLPSAARSARPGPPAATLPGSGQGERESGVGGSLVDRVERRAEAADVFFRLEPATDGFLVEHLLHGRPLLPAVMGLEIVAQAAQAAAGSGRVAEVSDFVVEQPLGFPDDRPRTIRAVVTREADLARVLGLANPASGGNQSRELVHFRGSVRAGEAEPILAAVGEPPFPLNPMVYRDEAALTHGPSFRSLEGLFLDRSGGWGRLVAPLDEGVARPRGRRGWTVPAELLDGALVACAVYSYILCGRRVEVPIRIDRVRFGSCPAPGEACRIRFVLADQTPRESVYGIVMTGLEDRPILAVDGLHLALVPDASD